MTREKLMELEEERLAQGLSIAMLQLLPVTPTLSEYYKSHFVARKIRIIAQF